VIVLDTNVLSELMKRPPDARVLEWANAQPVQTLFTTAVSYAEVLFGIELLAEGQRRSKLALAAEAMFKTEFAGRVLPFDSAAAEAYAPLAVRRRQTGNMMPQFDAQIAAIAHSRGAAVATRNVADFANLELKIVDPWT
jgi:predicted nucleic acid-binding protein